MRFWLVTDRSLVGSLQPNEVLDRAKKWFPNDSTFADGYVCFIDPLGRQGVRPFDDMIVLRNRIAHASGRASDRFAELRARMVATAQERKGLGPGGFLRRSHGPVGTSSWFSTYHDLMERAADVITT